MTPEIVAAVFIFFYMLVLFVLALYFKDNSIADIAWGPGFVGIAWLIHLRFPAPGFLWAVLPTTFWGLRLGIYLFLRKIREKREDWRYADWRQNWGKWFYLRSFLQVFMLQGFFMWIIALPLLQRPLIQGSLTNLLTGLLLFIFGFLWESIADYQLSRFKRQQKEKGVFLQTGLWALSRHPNYFGEILLWWGIWLILIPSGNWYISILSPICITWLLTRVSGVPMLEDKFRKYPGFEAYAKNTPALIPRFWKKFERDKQ